MGAGAQGLLFSDVAIARGGSPKTPPPDGVMFDASETEDIVLVRPPMPVNNNVTQRVVARHNCFEPKADDACRPVSRPPRQIGHGRLVNKRLAWRPGDPFGQSVREYAPEFVWRRMLTSAGLTAVCGLAAVWLLRTIFA
jgi:hypothetical protein